jgi:hypothetical protein
MGILAATVVTVIVELFTSEGCSSCPPADSFLQKLADSQPVSDVQIVALGEHVDYWNRLGWKDRFSSAAFTERQQAYANHFKLPSIYTPQMVVDGRTELVGTDVNAARNALEQARRAVHGVLSIKTGAGTGPPVLSVTVTADQLPPISSGDRADIIVAITEDRLASDVKRGENQGKVLAHAAVVRHLAAIGEATQSGASTVTAQLPLSPEWKRENLRIVAFVQARRSRAILAASTVPAPR